MNTVNAAIPLSQVVANLATRISTGIPSVDWCFGSTDAAGRRTWGLPAGALTLVSGASGSGKSRLAIKIAAAMTRGCHRVLYAQSEVALAQFKGWVLGNRANHENLFATQAVEVEELTAMIANLRPSLVVIDSISMMTGVCRASSMKQTILNLKRAIEAVGAHGLLLSHENARGGVKGGTTLPHLVDVVARVERSSIADWVTFEVGKNRFGPSGRSATFTHQPVGLTPVCVSDDAHPMFKVRFDPMSGAAYRRIPVYGTGKTVEVGDDGNNVPEPARSFLSRLWRR